MTGIKTGAAKCPHVNGRLQTVYTDEMLIQAVKDVGEATPRQVADVIGCNTVIARKKLKSLVERGLIQGKNIAGRWVFWC